MALKPCSVKYRQFTGIKKEFVQAYLMIGNQIVYEPRFTSLKDNTLKKHFNANSSYVDMNSCIAPKTDRKSVV